MARVLAQLRLREIARDEALEALKRRTLTPRLQQLFDTALAGLGEAERAPLQPWVQAAIQEVLSQIDLFLARADDEDEADRKAELEQWQHCLSFNLVVDHAGQRGAPVVLDNNPQMRSLFGSIEHPGGEDAGPPDHTAIHAGGLLQAHGGYLMLHLSDLIEDEPLWERCAAFCARASCRSRSPAAPARRPAPACSPTRCRWTCAWC
jgi:predicted ATP-dependent protease